MDNMRNQPQPQGCQAKYPVFKDLEEMPMEVYLQYQKQVEESDGFDVDDFPNYFLLTRIIPHLDLKESFLKIVTPFAESAIEVYNKQEVLKIEKVNTKVDYGVIYYITFEAKDKFVVNGVSKTFQAKVFQPLPKKGGLLVEFCRLKPTPAYEGFISTDGVSASTASNEGFIPAAGISGSKV